MKLAVENATFYYASQTHYHHKLPIPTPSCHCLLSVHRVMLTRRKRARIGEDEDQNKNEPEETRLLQEFRDVRGIESRIDRSDPYFQESFDYDVEKATKDRKKWKTAIEAGYNTVPIFENRPLSIDGYETLREYIILTGWRFYQFLIDSMPSGFDHYNIEKTNEYLFIQAVYMFDRILCHPMGKNYILKGIVDLIDKPPTFIVFDEDKIPWAPPLKAEDLRRLKNKDVILRYSNLFIGALEAASMHETDDGIYYNAFRGFEENQEYAGKHFPSWILVMHKVTLDIPREETFVIGKASVTKFVKTSVNRYESNILAYALYVHIYPVVTPASFFDRVYSIQDTSRDWYTRYTFTVGTALYLSRNESYKLYPWLIVPFVIRFITDLLANDQSFTPKFTQPRRLDQLVSIAIAKYPKEYEIFATHRDRYITLFSQSMMSDFDFNRPWIRKPVIEPPKIRRLMKYTGSDVADSDIDEEESTSGDMEFFTPNGSPITLDDKNPRIALDDESDFMDVEEPDEDFLSDNYQF